MRRLVLAAQDNSSLRGMIRRLAYEKALPQELVAFQQIMDNIQKDIDLRRLRSLLDPDVTELTHVSELQDDGRSDIMPIAHSFPSLVSETQAHFDARTRASRVTWAACSDGKTFNGYPADPDEGVRAEVSGKVFEDIEAEERFPQLLPPDPKQDDPFTDSGYASGLNFNSIRGIESGVADKYGHDRNGPDARTVYSGDSTVPIHQTQKYISELSSTIHGRLGGNIDAGAWKSLSKRLFGLLKDFAIKLGLESSAQVNRDIMYFIHKRGRYVFYYINSFRQTCIKTEI